MSHLEFPPPKALKNLVQSIWWHEEFHTIENAEHILLPDSYIELGFHLGNTKIEFDLDQFQILPNVYILGLQNAPLRLHSYGLTQILGVRFYAWGAVNLLELGTGVQNFQTRVMPQLQQFAKTIQRYLEQHDIQTARASLETWLLELYTKIPNHALTRVTPMLYSDQPSPKIRDLALMLGLSERQLERVFLKQVGRPAKNIVRLIRFQRATAAIHHNPKQRLTELAHELGYADQAHFIRDFRLFAGISPKAFAQGKRRNLSEKFNSDLNPAG